MQVGALVAGKYRILRKLGEGGMGSVWLARNEVTEREFAIKFLHANQQRTSDQLARFFQEAKVAGKLRHPSILEIFDAGTEPSLDGAPYLVMELLDGVGLDEAIRRAGALPLGSALEIVTDVCRGLALAHEKGIIHRDLKPSNVFLHRIGNGALVPKVLDFGISKVLSADATGHQVTGVTRTGAVLGSPLYMSPEQAAGDKSIDARSDVHALGALLWECLTGRAPFTAETYWHLLQKIIQDERPSLRSVLANVPDGVAALVDRALDRDRNRRFANAGKLADALEQLQKQLGLAPKLGSRTGAEQFFATLGASAADRAETESSTTAAVEVPSFSGDRPEDVVKAQSGDARAVAPTASPPESAPPSLTSFVPRRSGLRWGVALAAVLVVGAAAAALLVGRDRTPSVTSADDAPLRVSSAAPETGPTLEPSVAPVVSAEQAPAASASVAPSAVAGPPKPPRVPTTTRGPKAPGTGGAVNRGVTSSGL